MSNENLLIEAVANLSHEQLLQCADGDEKALASALLDRSQDRFGLSKKEKLNAIHALMKGPEMDTRRKIVVLYETMLQTA
ncbi:MAG: hypothetical protein QG672_2614 [Pseudomonadota bacterium]|nr:hypothetical protein [Pseudomonadota bacterium]